MPLGYKVMGQPENFPVKTLKNDDDVKAEAVLLKQFVADIDPADIVGYITVFALRDPDDPERVNVDVQTQATPVLRTAMLNSLVRHHDDLFAAQK